MPARARIALLLVSLFVITSASAATWTTIDVPGKNSTIAYGINLQGDIVGTYNDGGFVQRGFLLSGGIYTNIDFPGAPQTFPFGINDLGEIVGQYVADDNSDHGFLFDGQSFITLDYPGALVTFPRGINNAGQIVGGYYFSDFVIHGFLWTNGIFTTIDIPNARATQVNGINNLGHLTGPYEDAFGTFHGFVRNPQGNFRFPDVNPTGVTDHRVLTGFLGDQGFKLNLTTGSLRILQFPDAKFTRCFGINSNNQIVGQYNDAQGSVHGFLRTP